MTLFGKKVPEFFVILGVAILAIFIVHALFPAKLKAFILGAKAA